MSAGDLPSLSATVCGVAPRTNCITGNPGLAGARVAVLPAAAGAAEAETDPAPPPLEAAAGLLAPGAAFNPRSRFGS